MADTVTIASHPTPSRIVLGVALLAVAAACSSTVPTDRPGANSPAASPSQPASPAAASTVASPTVRPTTSDAPATLVVSPSPSPTVRMNAIAVFDVLGETFRIEIVGVENLAHARSLLAGVTDGHIPSGLLAPGDGGVNAPWSWHIDPTTLEWADVTTEVCDGLPSQIEAGTFTYPRFCPWAAVLIKLE